MSDARGHGHLTLNISAVERDTGLSKDTLRAWERRYGFPRPLRDACGERVYSIEDVDKLRLLRRLMDAGHRPGKIIGQPLDSLRELAGQAVAAPPVSELPREGELQRWVELVAARDIEALRSALSQLASRLGVGRFVVELAAPLDHLVAAMQLRGRFEPFEARLYAECMQVVLRQALASIPAGRSQPCILLTTFPGHEDVRALLMVEALLALDGCRCLSLGVQAPLSDIGKAARAQQADIVALSLSPVLNSNRVLEGLAELRARLPADTELWTGGSCPILLRRAPPGVHVIDRLDALPGELARWRVEHERADRAAERRPAA